MKNVLIARTSKGTGLETALAFGKSDYKVFAAMRNTSMAEDIKQRIAAESLDIIVSEMDVDSDASVKKGENSLVSKYGNIDVLVNNAGIERHGSDEELSLEDFKSVMETNYFGVLRSVLPEMRKSQERCNINESSVSGHISSSPLGAYAASKFALEALSEALAGEVKPFNIRVAIVEPGIINTQMAGGISIDKESLYPHSKRLAGLFSASLKTPPTLVADKILEVAESGTWKLRHPVGPDVEPFIQWRKSMTDEQWIDWSAYSDEDWYKSVELNFG